MRISVNLEEELVQSIDEWAKANFVNRTSAMSVLLARALKQDALVDAVIDANKSLKQISDDSTDRQ